MSKPSITRKVKRWLNTPITIWTWNQTQRQRQRSVEIRFWGMLALVLLSGFLGLLVDAPLIAWFIIGVILCGIGVAAVLGIFNSGNG